ncbi:hypothetical protein HaLaN_27302 [Haematococcus lacustris]|uniref:Uncharacterized protein n=1 Tax=Haematococcus lacustris TaxID=44745 RepID=A0A6A0A7W4_HAELA|nr:hypothetical protein HaLaN_27302 [Haematococcus lacustris]
MAFLHAPTAMSCIETACFQFAAVFTAATGTGRPDSGAASHSSGAVPPEHFGQLADNNVSRRLPSCAWRVLRWRSQPSSKGGRVNSTLAPSLSSKPAGFARAG